MCSGDRRVRPYAGMNEASNRRMTGMPRTKVAVFEFGVVDSRGKEPWAVETMTVVLP